MESWLVVIIILVLLVVIATSCIKVVPQAYAYVLERVGGYEATWHVGIHFKIPFLDTIAKRVPLKEQVVDFPPQPAITKDTGTMRIDK